MSRDVDRARALAILELESAATSDAISARYRELARRWHPDRWAHDRASEADAATRMRQLNWAIQVLRDGPTDPAVDLEWPDREDANAGRPLTDGEKAHLVGAVGQWNPVGALVRASFWLVPLFFSYVLASGHGTRSNEVPPTGREMLGSGALLLIALAVLIHQRRTPSE